MDDLLSQEEIDALLHGVDEGDVETENDLADAESEVVGYDLTSQDRVVRGRMPTLEMINERFARLTKNSLQDLLKRSPNISVGGIQIQKFSEYVANLQIPSSINRIRLNPLKGSALIVLDPKLVFKLVDNFFGGGGKESKIEGREFTPTEQRIVERVVQQIFDDMKEAWQSVYEINPEFIEAEINPSMVNAIPGNEVVVVSHFHVDLEGGGGDIHITMPNLLIDPIRDILDAGNKGEADAADPNWARALQNDIADANVEVNCTLVEKEIPLRDIIDLEAGDVITIDMPEEFVMTANGTPVFHTKLGVSRGNLALQVISRAKLSR